MTDLLLSYLQFIDAEKMQIRTILASADEFAAQMHEKMRNLGKVMLVGQQNEEMLDEETQRTEKRRRSTEAARVAKRRKAEERQQAQQNLMNLASASARPSGRL